MDTQPANAAKDLCPVTMETGPVDVAMEPCSLVRTEVSCAVTSPGHVTMDSAHSPRLAGSSPQGSGREGCLDSATGCGKDSQEENSGLGGGRLEGGQGVLDEACPDGENDLTSRLDDSGIDTAATDLACHGNDTSVCHQVDTDGGKTVIDTGRRCHTECSAGVTSCLEASSRHCDTSDCVTGTACDGAIMTPTMSAEGSTDSPRCDSVSVTQNDDTSSVCQKDPVPGVTHCWLDTNTAAAVVSSEAKVTDGCKEACTKTMNCIDADTCTKTMNCIDADTCTKTMNCIDADTCTKTMNCIDADTCTKTMNCIDADTCTKTMNCIDADTCTKTMNCIDADTCTKTMNCIDADTCTKTMNCIDADTCTKTMNCIDADTCTKTMNCIDADTYTKTKDTEHVTDATSALEVNVGRGLPGARHVAVFVFHPPCFSCVFYFTMYISLLIWSFMYVGLVILIICAQFVCNSEALFLLFYLQVNKFVG